MAEAMRSAGPSLSSRLRAMVAMVLGSAVHAVTLLLVLTAGWLATRAAAGAPALWPFVPGGLLLAWLVRPRFGRAPRKFVLPRDRAPRFFELLDALASAVGSPAFDFVVITFEPNAATSRVGFRQRRVLYLGLPLWVVLDWPERTAVLAHELGHQVNHDPRRRIVLSTSLSALRVWLDVLTPRRDAVHIAQVLFRAAVRAPLRLVAKWLLRALLRLSSSSSRVAEYRADLVAARLVGSAAAISALDKTLLLDACMWELRDAVLWRSGSDVWTAELDLLSRFPARQRDRLRRADRRSVPGVYSTHPNVARRARFLESRPEVGVGSFSVPSALLDDVTAEFAPVLRQMDAYIRGRVERRLTPAQIDAGMGRRGNAAPDWDRT
ncbi:MAG: M48 family metallopeptidase [Frankiales bacterium]|nr:M48 family metallopeptidase [Frankiales bacterium]